MERTTRRPEIDPLVLSASPEEAAAVIAAVEQFLRDTAPAPAPPAGHESLWLRAARREGIGLALAPTDPTPWG